VNFTKQTCELDGDGARPIHELSSETTTPVLPLKSYAVLLYCEHNNLGWSTSKTTDCFTFTV